METALRSVAIEADAPAMKAYMKDHFEYIGVKSVARKETSRQFIKESLLSKSLDEELVRALWDYPYREFQYVAMDYLLKTKRYWSPEHLSFFQGLITTKSWWDTVDYLATNCIGGLIQKFPDLEKEMDQWNAEKDMWLIRTSLLYQLKYKDNVDTQRLARFILAHADSKEFFIQKAAGWALRQYAKFNPNWVRGFVDEHQLAPLTVREATKHLS